jgi:hypothetical protein
MGGGLSVLQAASDNKIKTTLALAKTFFIFMVNLLFIRRYFLSGNFQDKFFPALKSTERLSAGIHRLLTHHKQNTPQPHPSAGECLSSPLGGHPEIIKFISSSNRPVLPVVSFFSVSGFCGCGQPAFGADRLGWVEWPGGFGRQNRG